MLSYVVSNGADKSMATRELDVERSAACPL